MRAEQRPNRSVQLRTLGQVLRGERPMYAMRYKEFHFAGDEGQWTVHVAELSKGSAWQVWERQQHPPFVCEVGS